MAYTVKGIPQLQRRLKAVEKAAGRDLLGRIQHKAVYNAKKDVPRKTGRLGRSIARGVLAPSFAIVKATAGYAAYVELGTRPHDIKPRNAKVLAWPATAGGRRLSGAPTRRASRGLVRPTGLSTGTSAIGPNSGTLRFARSVHHPGTKPQPFLVPGAKDAIRDEIGAEPIIRNWNGAA
jgi:hypothetical protein